MYIWVVVMEVLAWDGSIASLHKVVDPEPDQKPYIVETGVKTAEVRVFRKWGEAATWDEALALFCKCIQETIPDWQPPPAFPSR